MTEGARGFRRRGTFAHRSPWSLAKSQDVGPAKSGQLNEAKATVLHLEASTHAVFLFQEGEIFFEKPGKLPSLIWAASGSCSTSSCARPKKSGKTHDEKASRGAPQTVMQMAWLFRLGNQNADRRNSGARIERWKEVRQLEDVPVRQTRVAERDDDVAVSSSDQHRKERNRMRRSDKARIGHPAGGGSARRGNFERKLFSKEKRLCKKTFENCVE